MVKFGRALLAFAGAATLGGMMTAGASAEERCEDMEIPMRDGVNLVASVHIPDGDGPFPTVLMRTPYGYRGGDGCYSGLSLTNGGSLDYLADGIAFVSQDVRGTFRSEGEFIPFFDEANDGYDTVQWIADQPWSDGNVGMIGPSYVGVTPVQAALAAPPALKAIAPSITATDYFTNWTYQNGVFDKYFALSWLPASFANDALARLLSKIGINPSSVDPIVTDWQVEAIGRMNQDWLNEPIAHFDSLDTLAPYVRDWIDNDTYNDYWRSISVEDKYDRIVVPVLSVGGMRDTFQHGVFKLFSNLVAEGTTEAVREQTMLMVDWGGHGGTGVFEYPPFDAATANLTIHEITLAFMKYHLKGDEHALDDYARVNLAMARHPDSGLEGATVQWIEADQYPLPGATPLRLYLGSSEGANGRDGDGTLSVELPGTGSDMFEHDPSNPIMTTGGALCCAVIGAPLSGAQDQAEVENRTDVLVYTSEAFEEETYVVGPVVVEFHAETTSVADTMFAVKLTNVQPDGTSVNIADSVVSSDLRLDAKAPRVDAVPGETNLYRVTLGDITIAVQPGHKLRLQIASSNAPRFETPAEQATQTIHHGEITPSFVEVTVVDSVQPR